MDGWNHQRVQSTPRPDRSVKPPHTCSMTTRLSSANRVRVICCLAHSHQLLTTLELGWRSMSRLALSSSYRWRSGRVHARRTDDRAPWPCGRELWVRHCVEHHNMQCQDPEVIIQVNRHSGRLIMCTASRACGCVVRFSSSTQALHTQICQSDSP